LIPPIITATATGVRLRIHVQPGASRTEIAGHHGDALRIRVATPPVDGRANDALVRYLADRLDVPRRTVEIVAGMTSRRKVVDVSGIDVAVATARLLDPDDSGA
jgi:uncharacterized protein (TIGR00251 family)